MNGHKCYTGMWNDGPAYYFAFDVDCNQVNLNLLLKKFILNRIFREGLVFVRILRYISGFKVFAPDQC